jgi:transcriptional regulator with XRE-family HTH domain
MLRALRAARKDAGLTLADVAHALGRPASFVSKCELGERRVDPIDLWRFAFLYGRPVTDFLPADPPRLTSGRRDGAKRAR